MYTITYFNNDMFEFVGEHGCKVWYIVAYKKSNGQWHCDEYLYNHHYASHLALDMWQAFKLSHKAWLAWYQPNYKYTDQLIEVGDRVLIDNLFGYVVDIAPQSIVVQCHPTGDYKEFAISQIMLAENQAINYQ